MRVVCSAVTCVCARCVSVKSSLRAMFAAVAPWIIVFAALINGIDMKVIACLIRISGIDKKVIAYLLCLL